MLGTYANFKISAIRISPGIHEQAPQRRVAAGQLSFQFLVIVFTGFGELRILTRMHANHIPLASNLLLSDRLVRMPPPQPVVGTLDGQAFGDTSGDLVDNLLPPTGKEHVGMLREGSLGRGNRSAIFVDHSSECLQVINSDHRATGIAVAARLTQDFVHLGEPPSVLC